MTSSFSTQGHPRSSSKLPEDPPHMTSYMLIIQTEAVSPSVFSLEFIFCISGLFGPFGPTKRGFRAIQWNPSSYTTSMTPIGMFWNKNLKTDQTVFEKMAENWFSGLFGPFGPTKQGFRAIQWHPSLYTTSMTPIGMFWNKNLKSDRTVFEKMAAKVRKRAFFVQNGRHFTKNANIEKRKKTPSWIIF